MLTDQPIDEQRSKNMAAIKSKNTTCELLLRKKLWAKGIRGWRTNAKMKGKPDIIFTKKKIVIFVDGCFWHGCELCYRVPKTRREYWEPKIIRNKERDREVNLHYQGQGWRVMRFWEHNIKKNMDDCVAKVIETVMGSNR